MNKKKRKLRLLNFNNKKEEKKKIILFHIQHPLILNKILSLICFINFIYI